MKMGKANVLKTLGASLAVVSMFSGTAQTSKELYNNLEKKEINKEISVGEVKSSLNTLSSSPARTVIKPTDHGFTCDVINALYFDPTDSTRVAGCGGGGLSIDNANIIGYGGGDDCLNYGVNGYSSFKEGDTTYIGTNYNSSVGGNNGGLVKLSPAGCSVNTSVLINPNSVVMGIEKYQGYTYVATSLDGLYVLDGNGTIIQRYTTANSTLPTNILTNLSKDNQGNLRVATGLGIVKIAGSTWNVYTSANTGFSDFVAGMLDIAVDDNGNVWTGNTKLFRFSGGVWSQVSVPSLPTGALAIKGIEVNQFGEVILATENNGVRIYNPANGQWRAYDTSNSPLTTNQVNDVAVDTTSQDKIHIGIGSDETGFILLKESTASYLPNIPAGAHITGQNSVQIGQTYTYALSTPITNAQEYEWSYTGNGAATILPKLGGTAVEITFGLGATTGNVVLKARNNYTKPITDTVQLVFAITNITTGIGENELVKEKIVVAPNPASEMISLLGIEKGSVDVIEIYDMTGKLIKRQLVGEGEETKDINVQDLVPGAYMILAKDTKHSTAFPAKFIKK